MSGEERADKLLELGTTGLSGAEGCESRWLGWASWCWLLQQGEIVLWHSEEAGTAQAGGAGRGRA